MNLDVSKIWFSDNGRQGGVILSPQADGCLDVPLTSHQLLPQTLHDVGEVLVHDGSVGVSLTPTDQQLTLSNLWQ